MQRLSRLEDKMQNVKDTMENVKGKIDAVLAALLPVPAKAESPDPAHLDQSSDLKI